MKDTPKPAQEFRIPALSRTWEVQTTYRECGAVTEVVTSTVALDKTSGERRAWIDGQLASWERAVRLLENADTQPRLISEILPVPASMRACLGMSA